MYSQKLKLLTAALLVVLLNAESSAHAAPPAGSLGQRPSRPAPEPVNNALADRQSGRGGYDLGWGQEGDEEDEPIDDRMPKEKPKVVEIEPPKSDDFFNQNLEGNSKKEDL